MEGRSGKMIVWAAAAGLARIALLGALLISLAVSPQLARAMDCQPLVPSSPTNTDQTFEGKLNGKIDGLFAKLAGASGDAEGKYHAIKQDTLKDYPNASDTYIWDRFIYLRCEQLADSKESDDKKSDRLDNLIKLYQAGPPKAK